MNILIFYFVFCTYFLNSLLAFPYYFNTNEYKNKKEYKKLNIDFDERSQLEYISENVSEKIFPMVSPREIMKKNDIFLISNISNSNYLQCNEYGYWKKIKTDKYGFNNINIKKNYDILISGDSYAHGFCVEKDKEAHNVLNSMGLNTYSIGIAGHGPLLTLASTLEIQKKIKFNEIYWLFYRNDFYDLLWEENNKKLIQYLNKNYDGKDYFDNIKQHDNSQLSFILENKNQKKSFSYRESFFELKFLDSYIKKIFNTTSKRRINEDLIKKIFFIFDYKFKDIKKKIIYLPDQSCFEKKKLICDREFNVLKKSLYGRNIELFDFRKFMNNKNYNKFYALGLKGKHFSNLGYEKIALFIYNNSEFK